MKPLSRNSLIIIFYILWFTIVSAHTVKSDFGGVRLWSKADPVSGVQSIRTIERMEEVEVLEKRTDRHGRAWLKVMSRRSPGWKRHNLVGWVEAKFFSSVVMSETASTEATAEVACAKCLNSSSRNDKYHLSHFIMNANRETNQTSKLGFSWPAIGPIRSGFGLRRHPILGIVKLHDGTDIAAGNKAPVTSAKAGVILMSKNGCSDTNKSCNSGAGNMIFVDHGDGTQTKYLHLSGSCPMPKVGVVVSQGEPIACVGSSGASTGPHLHFSVLINGKTVNPLNVLPRSNL